MGENPKLKVFSPTRTEMWDFCHLKPELRHWVQRVFAKRDLARFAGRAWATGMAALNRGKILGTTHPPSVIAKTVLEAFTSEMEVLREAGVQIEQADIEDTNGLLLKGVEKYLADDPLVKDRGWIAQDIELELPEHGHARIDWGGLDNYGGLCQVDYKLKLSLEARWYDKEVERYRHNHQMQHYCWAYSEYRHEPVYRYYICLVVLAPRYRCALHQYEVDPELQQAWLVSTKQKWVDMANQQDGKRVPDMATVHRGPYGDCEYQRACLEFKLDEGLMSTQYVKLPEEDHVTP